MTAYVKKGKRAHNLPKAKDIMVPAVIYVGPNTQLSTLLGKMKEHDISEVPVIEKGTVLGMVSYDVMVKRKRLPLTTKVKDIVVHPPKIGEDADIIEVAKAMVHSGFRAVPVVDSKGRLKGIIRRMDIAKAARNEGILAGAKASDLMSEMPRYVKDNQSIHKAVQIMRGLSIRAIPIVGRGDRVVGVVGYKDIAPYLYVPKHRERFGDLRGEKSAVNITVGSIMRTPPITVSPETKLEKCVDLMLENDISTLIVVDANTTPLGVLTLIDIIEGIASMTPEESVPINISGLELADPMIASSVFDMAQGSIDKIEKMFKVHLFNMHISEHHVRESVDKEGVYEIRARLYTDRGMYYAAREGYEPLALINEVFDTLESQVKKDHEKDISGKGGSRRWK